MNVRKLCAVAGIAASASFAGAAPGTTPVAAATATTADFTVDKHASLEYDGRSAVVTGTVVCPVGAFYIVAVGLTQERSGNTADWQSYVSFPECTGERVTWSVPVNMASPWRPGPADGYVRLEQYRGGNVAEITTSVRLRPHLRR